MVSQMRLRDSQEQITQLKMSRERELGKAERKIKKLTAKFEQKEQDLNQKMAGLQNQVFMLQQRQSAVPTSGVKNSHNLTDKDFVIRRDTMPEAKKPVD